MATSEWGLRERRTFHAVKVRVEAALPQEDLLRLLGHVVGGVTHRVQNGAVLREQKRGHAQEPFAPQRLGHAVRWVSVIAEA